ncbi:HWE histidine kinase domain-containing protein [Rhizobium sp. NPDC090275]|uniref:HWE histidine kinase domain-containing protein n=1 Tax=Rhizobium sp. NPDC090275 TaxID=3364498 RepID=UPI00383B96D8
MSVAIVNVTTKAIGFANDDFRALLEEIPISLQEFAEVVGSCAVESVAGNVEFSGRVIERLRSKSFNTSGRIENMAYVSLGRETGADFLMAIENQDTVVEALEPRSLTQSYLAMALQSSGIGAWSLNLKTHEAERTRSHDAIFGYEGQAPRWDLNVFLSHVDPSDKTKVERAFENAVTQRSNWAFKCKIHRIDGEVRWIEASGYPRGPGDMNITHYIGLVKDITPEVNAAEQRRLLFAELHHRVRNNLSIVRSLISSTFRTSVDTPSAVDALRRRITALSEGHDLLLQESGGPVTARQIVEAVVANTNPAPLVKFTGIDIEIALSSVTPLSMWIAELLARVSTARDVEIECKAHQDGSTIGWKELEGDNKWADDLSEPLVRNILPTQMDGQLRVEGVASRLELFLTLKPVIRAQLGPAQHTLTATTMLS